jgi:hypothetical protein
VRQRRGDAHHARGACLDHLGLRDPLQLGEVNLRDMTVQVKSIADKILCPY